MLQNLSYEYDASVFFVKISIPTQAIVDQVVIGHTIPAHFNDPRRNMGKS